MSNDLIVMDNSIVTSAYNLSVNEQRLILCALKQIPKGVLIDPKTPFYITRDDFIELGADPKVVAREIRTATRELMKKTLYVQTPVGVKQFHWLSEVLRYDRNAEQKLKQRYPDPADYNKYINALRAYNLLDALPTHKPDDNIVARVIFSPEIMPLLSDLRASFTQFLAQDVAEFGSIYTYRIYPLLRKYLNKETGKGWTQIDFNDLRYMLMLLDKYPLTADLKRWVIDPAIKEINEKSPLKAQYELIKKGRKFVAVKFIFELKETAKKAKNIKDQEISDRLVGLTDLEREIVAQKQEYARHKGIIDPAHIDNLINQAIERHRQAKEAEKQAQEALEKQKKEQVQIRQETMVAMFESLTAEQQDIILDEVCKNIPVRSFVDIFKKSRQANEAHKNPMFAYHFYELFGL